MEFTANFVKRFLEQLTEFNDACKKIDAAAEDELAAAVSEYEKNEKKRTDDYKRREDLSVSGKKWAFEDYCQKLIAINESEKNRLAALYDKIAEIKANPDGDQGEIEKIRAEVSAGKEEHKAEQNALWHEYLKQRDDLLSAGARQAPANNAAERRGAKIRAARELEKYKADLKARVANEVNEAALRFLTHKNEREKVDLSPSVVSEKYAEVYEAEPSPGNYARKVENPKNIRIATLTYDLGALPLTKRATDLLELYYPALYRHGKLYAPFCVTFADDFNYLFEMDTQNKDLFSRMATALVMRLFMMFPPNKINFTFIDPITLGETFALFTRLVDVDDKTSKTINGKIWTLTSDISERLRVLTEHIANVTQRCLQGRYENIQKYNEDAKQNAEPYQVIMIMDFPGSFDENSLRYLEQILQAGPKCGVYAVILKSDVQIAKMDITLTPLINNIDALIKRGGTHFLPQNDGIVLANGRFNDADVWFSVKHMLPAGPADENALFPSLQVMDSVIAELKRGIKEADKIVITFDESILSNYGDDEWFMSDSASELIIPIGTHGARNVQNLAFGVGNFHALIVGQIGSGKSSLLHTIIMSSLIKYSADRLQIFLVDFKRGVEFKIFANHKLDVFSAIAIESEREFGCSVLEHLDLEQGRRAEKFKRYDVDNIYDYCQKSGDVMPRILLIIDEFHFLFTKGEDEIGVKASAQFEQIIKQGRAFGLHVILASQSLAGAGLAGISQDVWGQVGIRIALKCPKADAKLILGDGNDAVDLLSQDNPGQAVYNSDCGNVVANTIFRVSYIDQDRQAQLLREISQRTKERVKLRQNPPKPETRILLSNIEDNINSPYQAFYLNGKNEFENDFAAIGESLQLFGNFKTTFTPDRKSNMLIIGTDEQKARTMFVFSALSLILGFLNGAKNRRPGAPIIYVLDYAPPEDPFDVANDALLLMCRLLPDFIKYVRYTPFETSSAIGEAVGALYGELTEREGGGLITESKYLMVFGLQRASELRESAPASAAAGSENAFLGGIGLSYDSAPAEQAVRAGVCDMFLRIVQFGAGRRMFSVIWEDHYKNFTRYYANELEFFRLRIGFTMPNEDAGQFMDYPYGSELNERNAVFSCYGNQKFRPYKRPDLVWLQGMCEKINKI